MSELMHYPNRSSDDRLWESALTELTSERRISAEEAEALRDRHDAIRARSSQGSRRSRITELAAYSGAALVIVGIGAVGSTIWDRIGEFAQLLIIGCLAVVMLVGGALVAAGTPGGVTALRAPQQATRRRLTAVMGIAGALLTCAVVALWVQASMPEHPVHHWMPLAFVIGLLIAVVTCFVAPGVVPTLAVLGFSAACVMSTIDAVDGMRFAWSVPVAGTIAGVVGALALARVLKPAVLVEAISLAAWLGAAAGGLAAGAEVDEGMIGTDGALWVGRVSIVTLVVLGAWMFARGADWPWGIAAAIGLAVLVQHLCAAAVGGAMAMVVAGVALIAASILLGRVHESRTREHPPPGSPATDG